jgi:hypothetical protein
MGNSWVGGQEPGASARGAGPRMEAPPRAEGPGRAGAGPGRGRHRRARRGRPRRGRGRRRGRGVGDRATPLRPSGGPVADRRRHRGTAADDPAARGRQARRRCAANTTPPTRRHRASAAARAPPTVRAWSCRRTRAAARARPTVRACSCRRRVRHVSGYSGLPDGVEATPELGPGAWRATRSKAAPVFSSAGDQARSRGRDPRQWHQFVPADLPVSRETPARAAPGSIAWPPDSCAALRG